MLLKDSYCTFVKSKQLQYFLRNFTLVHGLMCFALYSLSTNPVGGVRDQVHQPMNERNSEYDNLCQIFVRLSSAVTHTHLISSYYYSINYLMKLDNHTGLMYVITLLAFYVRFEIGRRWTVPLRICL